MGECLDFAVGETVHVTVPFDPPHSLTLEGAVRWVWEPFIDVGVGDTVIRFPREAFDCSGVEVNQPATVDAAAFECHMTEDDYYPEDEIDHDI